MATYRATFTLPQYQGGTPGHYPIVDGGTYDLYAGNTQVNSEVYAPGLTMYFKDSDSVGVIVNHGGAGSNTSIMYNDTGFQDEPDPTSPSGLGAQASGTTWSRTWDDEDDYTMNWWWWGNNDSTTAYYTGRAQFQRIECTAGGLGSSNVAQGSTLTITPTIKTALSGSSMLTASGSNGHKCFLKIWTTTSNGSVINLPIHTTGTNGFTWSNSGSSTGFIRSTNTSDTVTVGSGVATGKYRVTVCHYNPFSTSTSGDKYTNPYYGLDQNMGSFVFDVVEPSDSTPNDIDLRYSASTNNVTGAGGGNTFQTENAPLTGFNQTVTPTITGGEYQVNSDGNWWSTQGNRDTVVTGDYIRVRGVASTTYGGVTSVVLTIGSMTETWTITTESDPGGGGTGTGGAGSTNYGLIVYNSDGDEVIFGPNQRAMHVLGHSSSSISIGPSTTYGSSTLTPVEGMTTNNQDTIGVLVGGTPIVSSFGQLLTITYYNGYFTIRNNSTTLTLADIRWYAIRY
tara:strand:- start:1819 stop:3345 length:1527 start_codon:yes stop_codon:yes gene_type:complete